MKPNSRSLGWLMAFVTTGVLTVWILGASGNVWASFVTQPNHQTVPTMPPTQVPRPTVTPTEVPIATPSPTSLPAPLPPTAAPTPAPRGVDLRVQFGVNTPAAVPGEVIRYQIVVRNAGDLASDRLVVRDPLPAELEIVAVSTNMGQVDTRQGVVVTLDSLPAGAEWHIHIEARIRQETALGTIIENFIVVEHADTVWRSQPVWVALPPAELPRTGGSQG